MSINDKIYELQNTAEPEQAPKPEVVYAQSQRSVASPVVYSESGKFIEYRIEYAVGPNRSETKLWAHSPSHAEELFYRRGDIAVASSIISIKPV